MLNTQKLLTITQITKYLAEKIESDFRLSNLWLRGEVSNVSTPSSGHLYLTLKDDGAVLKAVMFRAEHLKLPFKVTQGLEVIVRGRLGIYAKGGIYQLYIQEMYPKGMGSLELAFQQLKEELGKKGYFDVAVKKNIPAIPDRIGIVTSLTGSVVKDFVNVVQRRYPLANLCIFPSLVQGEEAPAQIVEGIQVFNERIPVDVIVLARGGGTLEELWAFNTKEVAEAVFASSVPIVSAIGHETDVTISDMVADVRAATPSVAGELVVPSYIEITSRLDKSRRLLHQSGDALLAKYGHRLANSQSQLFLAANGLLERKKHGYLQLAVQLENLSPLKVLARGYAICQDQNGSPLIDSHEVDIGDNVSVILHRGLLECKVQGRKQGAHEKNI